MRIISSLLFYFLFTVMAHAQMDWKWPEDPEVDKLAKEKQAFYKIQMQTDKYEGAFNSLFWLYTNTPDLHESIYQDGAKVIDNLLETKLTDTRRTRLEDSLLWTYDMRMKYFNNEASVTDRKAYAAFKLYYKSPEKYPTLLELYQALYAYPANEISEFNLTPYMTLATYYYKSKPAEFKAENVLDVHMKITSVIDNKMEGPGDDGRLKKEQDKVDAFLNSLEDILSCEYIQQQLVPKFEANPKDLNIAKKIFSYSLKAKCSDQPYFAKAGETLFANEPSFSLANALGDKYYAAEDYELSLNYYTKAFELAETDEQKYESLMGQASSFAKKGNKSKSRSKAYEALSITPGAKEAYNLIGNLYFLSFDDCKKGESIVKDRAVFMAAYEMYEKAGNTVQMKDAKGQFPSIEDIFNENYEEGQKITVDCWINESVTVQRR